MTSIHGRRRRRLSRMGIAGMLAVVVCCGSCGRRTDDGADEKVTTLGSIEVTAQLVEILGKFPPNDLYDYVYILKYRILETHRGKVEGESVLVGHYNPLKPRSQVTDVRVKDIGGDLKTFQAGDTHRMAMEVPLDDHYMGPIINKYHGKTKGPYYWAVWTNRVIR